VEDLITAASGVGFQMKRAGLRVEGSAFDRDGVRARVDVARQYFPIPLEIQGHRIPIEPSGTPVTRPCAANRIRCCVLLRDRRQPEHQTGSQAKKSKKYLTHSTSAES